VRKREKVRDSYKIIPTPKKNAFTSEGKPASSSGMTDALERKYSTSIRMKAHTMQKKHNFAMEFTDSFDPSRQKRQHALAEIAIGIYTCNKKETIHLHVTQRVACSSQCKHRT